MSTCIIVMGCYRTGSSAVAGMLHKLGVNMGEKFDPPNSKNPRGFWEDVKFKNFHRQILEGENHDLNYKHHIYNQNLNHKIWGIKDPRLCILLSMLTGHLDDMSIDHKVVECIRSPLDITNSLIKSAGDKVDWLPYVQYYIDQKIENLHKYEGPQLNLTFDEVFNEVALDRIAQFVGKEVTTEAREWIDGSG